MTPDQLDLINETVEILKDYSVNDDTFEDLALLIEHAREKLEQVLYIQEDEGAERRYVGSFKHSE